MKSYLDVSTNNCLHCQHISTNIWLYRCHFLYAQLWN